MKILHFNNSITVLGNVKEGAPSLGIRIESGKFVIYRSSD